MARSGTAISSAAPSRLPAVRRYQRTAATNGRLEARIVAAGCLLNARVVAVGCLLNTRVVAVGWFLKARVVAVLEARVFAAGCLASIILAAAAASLGSSTAAAQTPAQAVGRATAPAAPASADPRSADDADLHGRVVDAQTGRPLPDAHVFIAASMIGAVTTQDGRYMLRDVPAGAHTLYVSMLGYASARVDTLLRAGVAYVVDFALEPTVVEGPEVTVTGERDRAWYRRLRRFTRLFIGETPNAEECVIENPEALSFDTRWWGRLTAEAREPLVIINRALGYRVTYFLEEFESSGGKIRFDGEPLFEPLAAPDSATATRWREARRTAYLGSFRHFMQSLLENTLGEDGFRVHRRYSRDGRLTNGARFRFERQGVLKAGDNDDEAVLDYHGYLEVIYERERADVEFRRWRYGTSFGGSDEQQSLVELTDGPTRVDAHGEVVDPYGVTVYGYFAYERIAELVPKEYRP